MAAMYRNKNQAETVNYIYGLSGRDLTVEQVEETFDELMQTAEEGTRQEMHTVISDFGTTWRIKQMETKFNFKEIQEREDRLAPGHRMCAGCGGTIAVRNVLKSPSSGR